GKTAEICQGELMKRLGSRPPTVHVPTGDKAKQFFAFDDVSDDYVGQPFADKEMLRGAAGLDVVTRFQHREDMLLNLLPYLMAHRQVRRQAQIVHKMLDDV